LVSNENYLIEYVVLDPVVFYKKNFHRIPERLLFVVNRAITTGLQRKLNSGVSVKLPTIGIEIKKKEGVVELQ